MIATDLYKTAASINISNIETVVVLAPHPDDESLGCGGLIAMLAQKHIKVFVVFITNGCSSHPNSKKYPVDRLAALRKTEAIAALKILNINQSDIFFMNKKDRALPVTGEDGFDNNTSDLKQLLDLCKADLVLVPYENDPHPDHKATWQMLMHIKENFTGLVILEYLIWLYNLGEEKDLPGENIEWVFADISNYIIQKQKAIFSHISQTTRLIDDDADGFMLTPDVLQHFTSTREYFLKRNL